MKKKTAFQIYMSLKDIKMSNLKFNIVRKAVIIINSLRQISEQMQEDVNTCITTLRNEEIEAADIKVREHLKAQKEKNVSALLPAEELAFYNSVIHVFNDKIRLYSEELDNQEVELKLPAFSESEFETLISGKDLSADQIATLYYNIVEQEE